MVDKQATSTDERLDRIEAHIAITDLIHEYARVIRRDEPEKVAALFTVDCIFEVRDGHPDKPDSTVRQKIEGREALQAFYSPMKGHPHPVPLIRNVMIEVDGDAASANLLMEAQVYGTENRFSGEYRDTFRRVDGGWLFASRVFTMFAGSSI